jgi:AP-1 complex subunit gamma-1
MDGQWKDILPHTLARMPVVDSTVRRDDSRSTAHLSNTTDVIDSKVQCNELTPPPSPDLLNLDELFGSQLTTVSSPSSIQGGKNAAAVDADLLSDIFTGPSASPTLAQSIELPVSNISNRPTTDGVICIKVFDKDGLSITMDLQKDCADVTSTDVTCTFSNYTHKDFEKLIFQAAVPRYVSMEMKPASGSTIPANNQSTVTQAIKVKNTIPSKPLMMRLKIQYTVGGRQIMEHAQVPPFPT